MFDLASVVRPLGNFLSSVADPDRRSRRLWVNEGRAHIEVRGVDRAPSESLRAAVKASLERLEGVHWAEINAITGRVAVAFDGEAVDVDDLVETIDEVEEAHDVADERFPAERPEHPGDREALQRNAVAVVADVIGLALSVFGQVLEATPIPAELASIVSLVDSTPRLRRVLEVRLGRPAADFGLAMANAAGQALAQGPTGLVLDIGYRLSLITEARARQAVWVEKEPELSTAGHGPVAPIERVPRPRPLPGGPIESYTDRASLASLGAFGVTWSISGSPRVASNALLSGMPKAARMGREAFACQMSRLLAGRGVVVLDPGVLRRLDRIDTVVIEAGVLGTGRSELSRAEGIGPWAEGAVLRRARGLFQAGRLDAVQRQGRWSLGPLDALECSVPPGVRARVRSLRQGGGRVLGLARGHELAGLVVVLPELDPLAEALVEAVVADGHMLVVAGIRDGVARRVGPDRAVAGGRRLASAVRELQAEGRAVAVIGRNPAALGAADCGIGLLRPDQVPPWAADMLVGPGLEDACLVVEALTVARQTSRTSAILAATGSAVGAVGALVGPSEQAAQRTMLAVNGAAMVSLGAGTWAGVALGRRPVPQARESVAWHEMEGGAVLEHLGSAAMGLQTDEVERRSGIGDNRPAEDPLNLGRAIVEELATPLTPILGVGAALSAAVGSITDAALVGGVVGANALISAVQRLRTDAAMQRLMATAAVTVRVLRGGSATEVLPEELVPGDIVLLGPGDLVPADCRILDSASLEVDESTLTGESLPVAKASPPCPDAVVAERSCMLYHGTTVAAGTASAVVVAVGRATEASKALLAGGDPPPTGVESRLRHLTEVTVPVSVLSGVGVTAASLMRGRSLQTAISSGVGLMVAAVPEGLPLLAGVAQLASARRLAARHILVRNPASVEALGRVDILCFDKTGTLTEGHITLQIVSDGQDDRPLSVLGEAHTTVLRVALRATPVAGTGQYLAHATDQAVLDGAATAGVEAGIASGPWNPLSELPFEAARGYHAVVGSVGGRALVAVKGAPEVVLQRCRRWSAQRIELDDQGERRLYDQIERLARRGLRVLAVAEGPADGNAELTDEMVDDLDFVGFLGLADAVRPTAAAAVDGLRRAGVDVAMITGDHPSTAEAIAAELGILDGRGVLTGTELDALDDPALSLVLPTVSVFARVTPAHKVRIVEGLQRAGRIVAMTGDGANDAPAIRLAHAGIALGQRGAAPATSRGRPGGDRRSHRDPHRGHRRGPGHVGLGPRCPRHSGRRQPGRGRLHRGRHRHHRDVAPQRPPAADREPAHRPVPGHGHSGATASRNVSRGVAA